MYTFLRSAALPFVLFLPSQRESTLIQKNLHFYIQCRQKDREDDWAPFVLTLLHSERPKLYTILAFLSAIGLNIRKIPNDKGCFRQMP